MVTSRPLPSPLRALRLRFRLLELGLFLPIVVTCILGLAYLRALTSRQHAVEAAGSQLAQRVADRTTQESSRVGDAAALAILEPVHRARPRTAAGFFAAMQSATDSLRACACGPLKEGAYFFLFEPETGTFAISSPAAAGADPRARLPASLPLLGGARIPIWAVGGIAAAGPWLIHYTQVVMPDGHQAVVGFDISMTSWWASTFVPALDASRRQFFPMLADPDTAFSAALLGGDSEVARTTHWFDGPSARVSLFGNQLFSLEVSLNPTVLPLLLSAAAPPAYPLLLGVLGASVVVSLLALFLLRQLRATLTQREAFVASISHELRTPLTEVLLHAETLALDRQTPESKARAATSIVRETRRLIGLVENALTVAGAGRPASAVVPRQRVRAAPVVESALRALDPAVVSSGARLVTELDDAAECTLDPVSLDRIVTNLVENALRYGPAGQRVLVTLREEAGRVLLAVEDEGPGVPTKERERLWNPFERGSAAAGGATTGTGLGLAIVKHLAESAGGRVSVSSGASGGARFIVSIPAHPDLPTPA